MEQDRKVWNTLETTVSYKARARLTPTLTHVVTYELVTSGAEDRAMSFSPKKNFWTPSRCIGTIETTDIIEVTLTTRYASHPRYWQAITVPEESSKSGLSGSEKTETNASA